MKSSIFKQAYPFENSWKKSISKAFVFGLFIFLFLQIFQPFGLHNYQSELKTVQLLGYGGVTFVTLLLSNILASILLPKWFSKSKWTVGKNILYTLWMFLLIGFVNLSYSVYLDFLSLSFKGFLFYQAITLAVGIFPVSISTFVVYNKRLKLAINEAKDLNESIQPERESEQNKVEIPSKNKTENLSLEIANLLAIKAVENYVEVYYLNKNQLNRSILRNTLKEIENSLSSYTFIVKCHRSCLVNLQEIRSFSGNAQGLTLHFNATSELEVPVSRAYVSEIKTQLQVTP